MNPICQLRHKALAALGPRLAAFLATPIGRPATTTLPADLAPRLQAGDILLVRGNTRFARLVATLTGSGWTHVAICIRGSSGGGANGGSTGTGDAAFETGGECIVEADVIEGVRRVNLDEFIGQTLLVIRPTGLDQAGRENLVAYLLGRLGSGYDLDHILGLTWMLVARRLGARHDERGKLRPADPARAICSTLVAHALEAAGLPVSIDEPIATGKALSLDHLVPGDFEHCAGMTTVFDSRTGGVDETMAGGLALA